MNDTEHTPGQLARIREYEASTDEALVAFYERAQTLPDFETNHAKYKVCDVGKRLAHAVRAIAGVETEGWSVVISANHARHISQRHGEAGQHDHSLGDHAHVGRIAFILRNFDEAGLLYDQNGKRVVSNEFHNSDGTPATVVNVRMRIDGLVAVQQAVPDSKGKCVHVVSMRIQK